MIKGMGIDLIEIARVEQAVSRSGDRFLTRVFTPGEIEYCYRSSRPGPHLAARFAAKEAVLKALGLGLRQVRWTEVAVERDEMGKPGIRLSGRAGEIARAQGITEVLITLSHCKDYALAQAIAMGKE